MGDFFVHEKFDKLPLEQKSADMQTCRGMLYYLMEELPYVPSEMQDSWFETERQMF